MQANISAVVPRLLSRSSVRAPARDSQRTTSSCPCCEAIIKALSLAGGGGRSWWEKREGGEVEKMRGVVGGGRVGWGGGVEGKEGVRSVFCGEPMNLFPALVFWG